MPYALIAIGLTLLITGAQNTYAALALQLQKDFTGSQSFLTWVIALGSVGAIGYVKSLQTFSTLFMSIIILAMLLSNQGFFQKFSAAIKGNGQGGSLTPDASAGPQTYSASS